MIVDAKLLFRLNTLTIDYGEGDIQYLPLNFLQKQANNESNICGFAMAKNNSIELHFKNKKTFTFDPSTY